MNPDSQQGRHPVYGRLFRIYARNLLDWPGSIFLLAGVTLNAVAQMAMMQAIVSPKVNLSFGAYLFATAFDWFLVALILSTARMFAWARRESIFQEWLMSGLSGPQILAPLFTLLFSLSMGSVVVTLAILAPTSYEPLRIQALIALESVLFGAVSSWFTAWLLILLNEFRIPPFFQAVFTIAITYVLFLVLVFCMDVFQSSTRWTGPIAGRLGTALNALPSFGNYRPEIVAHIAISLGLAPLAWIMGKVARQQAHRLAE